MRLLAGAAVVVFAIAASAQAAEPVVALSPEAQKELLASSDPKLAANKKLVWDMWRTFLQGGDIDSADKFLAPEYHQHNPNAETGLAGVKAYFRAAGRKATPPKDSIDGLISITAERDLVTLALVREYKDKARHHAQTPWV